jgi:putative lipoprotein
MTVLKTALAAPIMGLSMLLAPCLTHADEWTGEDKQLHFAVSAVLGVAAYSQTHERATAFGWAMLPGILKEVADSQQESNQFSGKDLAWDAAGAFVGVQAGHWMIGPDRVSWVKAF